VYEQLGGSLSALIETLESSTNIMYVSLGIVMVVKQTKQRKVWWHLQAHYKGCGGKM
jgi:hypothetical protein